ncbi:MAG: hypothetical protein K5644_05530 [Lachnospiraceae bacterium]|nr:hypothetical protein [Lachnospiraceae bacterium]
MDFGTSYLWAEDGCELYYDAANSGIASIFSVSNQGTLWIIQRTLGYICYLLGYPFNSIALFPTLLSIFTKLLETAAVFYFLSDKFSWIIKQKWVRFLIATSVLLAIPQNSDDLINCDTSSPFIFTFTVFLIGINAFREEWKNISVFEIVFLVLVTLSSAAAPFSVGVAGLYLVVYLIRNRKRLKKKDVKTNVIKNICILSIIIIAFAIQVYMIITSGRTNSVPLELFDRIVQNTLYFVWFPYCNYYFTSVAFLILGIVLIITATYFTKIKAVIVLYSFGFSWMYLLMCSLTESVENFYAPLDTVVGTRYYAVPYQIAVFFVGWVAYRFWNNPKTRAVTILLIITEGILLCSHYFVKGTGNESQYVKIYDSNVASYDINGDTKLVIPIAPALPYAIDFPISLNNVTGSEGFELKSIEEKHTGSVYNVDMTINSNTAEIVKEAYVLVNDADYLMGSFDIENNVTGSNNEIKLDYEIYSNFKETDNKYVVYLILDNGKTVRLDIVDRNKV